MGGDSPSRRVLQKLTERTVELCIRQKVESVRRVDFRPVNYRAAVVA